MVQGIRDPKLSGLSEQEAAARLKKYGYNEIQVLQGYGHLQSSVPRHILNILANTLKEPMFLLLIACTAVFFLLGEYKDGAVLLCFVVVMMTISFYQERKTERALEALRDLSSPRALVIRQGVEKRIAGREVVPGDILVLAEGDRVPADGQVLFSQNLSVDESLLTGESVPVRKTEWKEGLAPTAQPGGQDTPYIYSSTLVVQGYAYAEVQATGMKTEVGKIGKVLQSIKPVETSSQKQNKKMVVVLAGLGGLLCILVIVIYGLTRGDWIHALLAGLTLAMAMLPEEFPVVLTVFMALGAWRMSKKRVLTRNLPAIETLGSTTVLCVDKTGTLTMNQMTVTSLCVQDDHYDINSSVKNVLPDKYHELVEFGILASQLEDFDPMDRAIKRLGDPFILPFEHHHQDWEHIREYSLSKTLMALSHVWRSREGKDYVIAAKGAPEAIMELCHLDQEAKQKVMQNINRLARRGFRILAAAKGYFKSDFLPKEQHDFNFEFLGLLGLSDPVRPQVPEAVKECYEAGIRVIMITGDYPETAVNVAMEIGLENPDKVLTGSVIEALGDSELAARLKEVNVYARMAPEQKLRLVKALQANAEVVAMTGDGVNDAAALKTADIGIAMGERGSDVARESADLVLLNDDFNSIVQAVRLGRRIFGNLRKSMAYLFSVHAPIACISLTPVLLHWPLLLLPVHITFLEFIIDPACSVIFEAEAEEKNSMKQPPRRIDAPIIDKLSIFFSLLQGMFVFFIMLCVLLVSKWFGQNDNDIRAMIFSILVITNLSLIFINRSWTKNILETLREPNHFLWLVTLGTLVLLCVILYVPALQDIFKFGRLPWHGLLVCFGSGLLCILVNEAVKFTFRNRTKLNPGLKF